MNLSQSLIMAIFKRLPWPFSSRLQHFKKTCWNQIPASVLLGKGHLSSAEEVELSSGAAAASGVAFGAGFPCFSYRDHYFACAPGTHLLDCPGHFCLIRLCTRYRYIQGMSKKKGTLLKLALAKKFESNSF